MCVGRIRKSIRALVWWPRLAAGCLGLAGLQPLLAANLPAGFTEAVIPGPAGGNWSEAVGVTFSDAGRMFVWERPGRVWFRDPGETNFTQLLDISEEVASYSDHGLLGFAVDPSFAGNGKIYLLYVVDRHHLLYYGTPSYNSNSNEYSAASIGRVTRYTCTSSNNFRSVDLASRLVLLGQAKTNGIPICSRTHGVGSLVFGQDGTLLVSSGDGASAFVVDIGGAMTESYAPQALADGIIRPKEDVGGYRSQLVDSLSGKVLRIDPATGNGLPSNPFYDPADPGSARSKVWTVGLRNPFRMSLRPGSGSHISAEGNPGVLYIGNVGWNNWESLKVATGPAQNMGWPLYEGLELTPSSQGASYNVDVANLDAPNPLYPGGGCSQFFSFRQLLKQDTTNAANFPPFNNPCNAAQKIPATIPQFLHRRPVLDWNHFSAITRTGTYDSSGNATTVNVGAPGSPTSGDGFFGYCAIGGTWMTGNSFPTQYQNAYFVADWGQFFIKCVTFTTNDRPVAISDFATSAGAVTSMAQQPVDGSLYYVSYDYNQAGTVRKISYTGNRTPVAVASANTNYGPTPLNVQLSSAGSSDPDGQPITFLWNFGDGSPTTTNANPSHTYSAPAGVPTKFVATLTVTDTGALSSQSTVVVSVNNTPPNVAITSPVDGTLYSLSNAVLVDLTAAVSDAETTNDALLSYEWQVLLRHNTHDHGNPPDTNHVTSAEIEPTPCDGINTYFYRIILKVTDIGGLTTTREVRMYPDCGASSAPTISDIPDQMTTTGQPVGPINFTIGYPGGAVTNLQLSHTSSNTNLVPTNNIVFGGSGTNRTVTVTPAAGEIGTSVISVMVSDGTNSANDTFVLTVFAANTPPTITGIPNQTINEDTTTAALNFVVGDAETPAGSLTLTGGSSDPTLVPTNNIAFGGSGSNRTVTITPAPNQSGSTIITITASDGQNVTGTNFAVTVNPVNDAPTISPIPNQSTAMNVATAAIPFTVGDVETAAGSLTLSWDSSNPTLVPTNNIVLGGSGSNRTITVTPAANQSGSVTIMIVVSDGASSATNSFVLTVTAQPLGLVAAYGFNEGTGTVVADQSGGTNNGTIGTATWTSGGKYGNALTFNGTSARVTVADASALDLTNAMTLEAWVRPTALGGWRDVIYKGANDIYYLMASSDNSTPALGGTFAPAAVRGGASLPLNSWVHLAGTYDGATLRLFTNGVQVSSLAQSGPIQTSTGALTIGGDSTYGQYFAGQIDEVRIYNRALSAAEIQTDMNTPVGFVNTAPTISAISNQVTTVNTPIGPIPFTIGDAQTAASNLVVTASSSNTNLVATNGIALGGTGSNRTATITVASNQLGSATIFISVGDGLLSASNSFLLSVNPAVLSVTASNFSRGYGQSNPPLGGNVAGLQAGDNITATFITSANTNSPVGGYPITFNLADPGNKLGNYVVTTNNGTLNVLPALLVATANNQSRTYGQPNPAFTFSYAGFVNGENTNVLDVLPIATTLATNTSAPGAYTITPSGGADNNYAYVLVAGTLTVTAPGPITIASAVFLDSEHLQINGTGDASVTYTIQMSEDLLQWSNWGTATADGAGLFQFEDATVAGAAVRFYRATLP